MSKAEINAERAYSLGQIRSSIGAGQGQVLRNVDPFERKRRIAQLEGDEISSRKVTSRKEDNQAKQDAIKNTMSGITPSAYMDVSKQSYFQEFEKPKGSIYTQTLSETHMSEEGTKYQINKQRQYLRTLRFGFVKDFYNRSFQSSSSQRKMKIAMYLIPAGVSFGLAVSNYLQQSFGVYLKY